MSPITHAIIKDVERKDIKFQYLYAILTTYMNEIQEDLVAEMFDFEKKPIDRMLLEQPGLFQYYGIMAAELRAGVRYFESLLEEKKGEIWIRLTEKHSRDLSQTDKTNYINNDVEYLTLKRPYLAVRELSDKFDVIVEALKGQGYALSTHVRSKMSTNE